MAKKPNPDLVKYIEKHLEKGFKINHIKKKLAEVGHPIEAIEDAAAFVISQQPKKRVPTFMIVYGVILMLVIAGFGYYIWFKATEQVQYQETVKQIEQNRSYIGKTDVQLLKLAALGDRGACGFIKDHNLYYACVDKYWNRPNCQYESLIGESSNCWSRKAVESRNFSDCNKVTETDKRNACFETVFDTIKTKGNFNDCNGNTYCLNFILKNNQPTDTSFCNFYSSDEEQGLCVATIANRTKNINLCESTINVGEGLACMAGFASSFEDVVKYCDEHADYVSRRLWENGTVALKAAGMDDYTINHIYCFQMMTRVLVEKDIYTCKQLLDFVSARNPDYLKNFMMLYKMVSDSDKAKNNDVKYYGCLK